MERRSEDVNFEATGTDEHQSKTPRGYASPRARSPGLRGMGYKPTCSGYREHGLGAREGLPAAVNGVIEVLRSMRVDGAVENRETARAQRVLRKKN